MTGQRIFVTSLGTGNYQEAKYRLGLRSAKSRFAPVAIAELLGLEQTPALVLLTEKASATHWTAVSAELRAASLSPELLEIPDGRTEDEILSIFSRLVGHPALQAGVEVVLDVTNALRHLPFVYLASLAYLQGLREVRVGGIFYGAFELDRAAPPVIELTALVDLLDWYHGLQALRDGGDAGPLSRSLRTTVGKLFRAGQGDPRLSDAANAARDLADALAAGLPLEIGQRARRLIDRLERVAGHGGAPAARQALRTLVEAVEPLALPRPVTKKSDIALDEKELERQLAVVEWYARNRAEPRALLVLRELLVSLAQYRWRDLERWLDYTTSRFRVATALHGIAARARDRVATDAERALAALWEKITERRNGFAHAGFREQEVHGEEPSEWEKCLEQCRRLLARDDFPARPGTGPGTLLVTPLGRSPGVLFSAVRRVSPTSLVVVTSDDARPAMGEALERAGYHGTEPLTIVLPDPFRDYDKVTDMAGEAFVRQVTDTGRVFVNVTGGTTAMQLGVEQLGVQARRRGVEVRRFGLIDRRDPAEQRAHPWLEAEMVEFDAPSGAAEPDG